MVGGVNDPEVAATMDDPIDVGTVRAAPTGPSHHRSRVVGGVLAALVIVSASIAGVIWASSGDDQDSVALASVDAATTTSTSIAATSTTSDPSTTTSTEPVAPTTTAPAPTTSSTAPVATTIDSTPPRPAASPTTPPTRPPAPPQPSPPTPVEPEGYEPPGDTSIIEQRGLPLGPPVPRVGDSIDRLGTCPCYNAAGQKFGGGPMTTPNLPGFDFTAVMDGLTIIGWHRVGDTELVRTAPGAPPLGIRMYASDGVTFIGYS